MAIAAADAPVGGVGGRCAGVADAGRNNSPKLRKASLGVPMCRSSKRGGWAQHGVRASERRRDQSGSSWNSHASSVAMIGIALGRKKAIARGQTWTHQNHPRARTATSVVFEAAAAGTSASAPMSVLGWLVARACRMGQEALHRH